MAGLIASALAGGIAGAGAAAGTALGRMQETEEKKTFEMMRSELEMQRQTAIENLRATNAERLAVGEQTRRREDAIDAATGRVGAATREAAGLTRRQQLDFETNPDNVKARAGAAGTIARATYDATPQKLSPGEQVFDPDGKLIRENKRQTGAEAALAGLERRIAAGGLGGGKGGGAKIDPMFKERWDTLEREGGIIERSFNDLQKTFGAARIKILSSETMDKAGKDSALADLDADFVRQQQGIEARAARISFERSSIRVKSGDIKPEDMIGAISEQASSVEDVEQSISQAKRLDRNFGQKVEAGLKPRLEELRAERKSQGRQENRGFDPTVKQDMGEAPRGIISGSHASAEAAAPAPASASLGEGRRPRAPQPSTPSALEAEWAAERGSLANADRERMAEIKAKYWPVMSGIERAKVSTVLNSR